MSTAKIKERLTGVLPKRFLGSDSNLKISGKSLDELVVLLQDRITNNNFLEIFEIVVHKTRLIDRKTRFAKRFLEMLKKYHPNIDRSNIVHAIGQLKIAKKKSIEFKKEQNKLNPKPKKVRVKKIKRRIGKAKVGSRKKGGPISSIYGKPTNHGKPIYNLPRS